MCRKIMNISVADEENMYPFPDDIPINIANPADIKKLKDIFAGRDLYIAVGTDVIENASAYRAVPTPDSIHTVNHIAFATETRENAEPDQHEKTYGIQAKVIRLTLDKFYEDISSTKIRENIDLNRDISNLIDAVAQNFIYDKDRSANRRTSTSWKLGKSASALSSRAAPKACGPSAAPSGIKATIRRPSTATSKRTMSGRCTSTTPARSAR